MKTIYMACTWKKTTFAVCSTSLLHLFDNSAVLVVGQQHATDYLIQIGTMRPTVTLKEYITQNHQTAHCLMHHQSYQEPYDIIFREIIRTSKRKIMRQTLGLQIRDHQKDNLIINLATQVEPLQSAYLATKLKSYAVLYVCWIRLWEVLQSDMCHHPRSSHPLLPPLQHNTQIKIRKIRKNIL